MLAGGKRRVRKEDLFHCHFDHKVVWTATRLNPALRGIGRRLIAWHVLLSTEFKADCI